MAESVDVLYARWQRAPDPLLTVMLCDALRGSSRLDLVETVGAFAQKQQDPRALIAAGRMYGTVGRLDEAQSTLVAAGRLAPRDGEVFRWLGEILLRKGDAERAEKVLERAVQFGTPDGSGQLWLARARERIPVLRTQGAMSVAREVASSFPMSAPLPPTPSMSDDLLDEIETLVRDNGEMRAALSSRAASPFAAPLPPPVPPPMMAPQPQTAGIDLAPPSSTEAVYEMETAAFGATVSAGMSSDRMLAAMPESARAPLPPPPIPAGPAVSVASPPAHLPEARDVLEALQIAGIFEPGGAVAPDAGVWAKPERGRRRIASYAILIGFAVLVVGGGAGTFYFVQDTRAKQHVEAERLLAKVDEEIHAGKAAALDGMEKDIAHAFDLESRSPHAALTWLRERAVRGLLAGGAEIGFEDPTNRAREVGVDASRTAFAPIASYLFQNDTAGAAAALARSDKVGEADAFYQLFAGLTFERAGDARALERYEAATKLDPDLFVAQVLFVRAMAEEGDPARAAELARALREKYPTRPETAALVVLAWARNAGPGAAPTELKEVAGGEAALPAPLAAVPHAARALVALEEHKIDDAKPELSKALEKADSPGMATFIGNIALSTGDEALARRAALAAVSYAATYPAARVLAARVAILGGRLDEALKAAEELPEALPEAAVIVAGVAYERLDGERVERALEALPEKSGATAGGTWAQSLLSGKPRGLSGEKLAREANDEVLWADLVAMDEALDTGDVDAANRIAESWSKGARPLRLTRLARLARVQGKNDEALALSQAALEAGPTPRAFAERVRALVAADKASDAVALFKTNPNGGGPLAKWLRAYAIASSGKVEEARGILAGEDPPPVTAPAPLRLAAAMAYGAVKDSRKGGDVVKALAVGGLVSPELQWAAERLGVKLAAKPKRR